MAGFWKFAPPNVGYLVTSAVAGITAAAVSAYGKAHPAWVAALNAVMSAPLALFVQQSIKGLTAESRRIFAEILTKNVTKKELEDLFGTPNSIDKVAILANAMTGLNLGLSATNVIRAATSEDALESTLALTIASQTSVTLLFIILTILGQRKSVLDARNNQADKDLWKTERKAFEDRNAASQTSADAPRHGEGEEKRLAL